MLFFLFLRQKYKINMSRRITQSKNCYIPKVRRPINSYAELDLGQVLAKHEAERFLENPKAYLDSTHVTNFTIIYAEQEAREERERNGVDSYNEQRRIAQLRKKAEVVFIQDFKYYEPEHKVTAFKGTLRWRGRKDNIEEETKAFMKQFIRTNDEKKCIFM